MKIVSMPIKKEWFDKILSGEKKEEYRKIGDYWRRRLLFDKVDAIKLINGYGRDKPFIIVELKDIIIGEGKKEWGAVPGEEYYILELGEIILTGNLNYEPMDKIISLLDIQFANGFILKEGSIGEILEVKKYKGFKSYGVKFEGYEDIYILDQDQFKSLD